MFSGNLHEMDKQLTEARTNLSRALAILHIVKTGTNELTPLQVKEMVEEAESHLKKIAN